MSYEIEKTIASESQATRISFTGQEKLHNRELVRGWKRVVDEFKQTVLDYLDTITTVTDPQFDNGKVASGTWRVVSNSYSKQWEGYVQVLRDGWATTVLTDGLPNDECMVQSGVDTRSDDRRLNLYWRNISSAAVSACMAELRAVTIFTNPTIQGEVKTGKFAIGDITPQQADDGSYTISLSLTRVATITAIADLAALTAIRADSHDIENPFGLEGLYASHVGKRPRDGIVLTYRALSASSADVLRALTDEALQSLLPAEDQEKYEFTQRIISEEAANILTLKLAYQYVPLVSTISEATSRLVSPVRFNQSGKLALTRSFPRIKPSDVDTLITSDPILTAVSITDPQAEGKTYTGDWLVSRTYAEMTANDGARIIQDMVKSGDQQLFTKCGTDSEHLVCEFNLWDATTTAIDAFLADSDPFNDASVDPKWATPEVGITKIVKRDTNADHSINLYAVYSTTAGLKRVDLVSAPLKTSASKTVIKVTAYGYNVPVADLATYNADYDDQTVNVKSGFQIKRRDEHTFDFEAFTETYSAIETPVFTAKDGAGESVTVKRGERLASTTGYEAPGSVPQGSVVEVDHKKNELGSTDAVVKTTTEKDQTSTDSIREGAIAETVVSKHTAGSSAATPEAATANQISTAKNKPTPGGNYESEKTTKTLNPTTLLTSKTLESSAFGSKAVTLAENILPANVPTASGNAKVEVKHNGVGGLNVIQEVLTESDVTTTDERKTSLETVSIERHTAKSSAVSATSGSTNFKSEVKNEGTPGGNFKTEKTDTTLAPATLLTEKVIEASAFGSKKLTLALNQAPADVPAASSGESVKVEHNGLGGINVEKTALTETDATTTDTVNKGGLETVVVTKHTASASAATVTTPAVNLQSKVSNEKTPLGNFKSEKEDTTKVSSTLLSDHVVKKDAFGTEVLTLKVNQTPGLTPQATIEGEQVEVKHNGLGGFDVEKKALTETDVATTDSVKIGTVETVTTTKHTADSAEATPTAPAVNLRSEVKNEKTPLGHVKSEKTDTVKAPITLVDGIDVEINAFGKKTLTLDVNRTSVSSVTGNAKQVVKHNGLGGLDVEKEVISETDATETDVDSTSLRTVTTTKHSASTAATPTATAQNLKSEVENQKTPGGNYKSSKKDTVASPWDSGALVVTDNVNGILTRKTQFFRNKTAIPPATAGQLVEAIVNELASYDGKVIERSLAAGLSTRTMASSSIIEWDIQSGLSKIAQWSYNTATGISRITGYTLLSYRQYFSRSVDVTVERDYSITEPSASAVTAASYTTGNKRGGSTSRIRNVIQISNELWAIETKTIVTGDWTADGCNTAVIPQ